MSCKFIAKAIGFVAIAIAVAIPVLFSLTEPELKAFSISKISPPYSQIFLVTGGNAGMFLCTFCGGI
jgi:hypothetical protein